MSDDPLYTYLEDHLAGAASAVDLLSRLRDEHAGAAVGRIRVRDPDGGRGGQNTLKTSRAAWETARTP